MIVGSWSQAQPASPSEKQSGGREIIRLHLCSTSLQVHNFFNSTWYAFSVFGTIFF